MLYNCNIMIYNFTAENFYSIKNNIEVNLVSKQSKPNAIELYRDAPFSEKISLIEFIGGPNASGKTNILRILAFLQFLLTKSVQVLVPLDELHKLPFCPFFTTEDKTTELSVKFSIGDDVFDYIVHLTTERILDEKLTRQSMVSKRSSTVEIFHRDWNEKKEHYDLSISKELSTIQSMTTLEEMSHINSRASFVAIFVNFDQPDGILRKITQYWENITTNIQVFGNLETNHSMIQLAEKSLHKVYENQSLRKKTIELLEKYDIGSVSIDRREEAGPNKDRTIYGLVHKYDNRYIACTLNYESSGTQKMLIILEKIVLALENGSVAVIDELDAFLHPDIFNEITKMFMSPLYNEKSAQLILSSQNYSILSALDKQQITLVEKNKEGQTEAWRLDEVDGVRADDNFYAKYLAGAYGAIPRIGDI